MKFFLLFIGLIVLGSCAQKKISNEVELPKKLLNEAKEILLKNQKKGKFLGEWWWLDKVNKKNTPPIHRRLAATAIVSRSLLELSKANKGFDQETLQTLKASMKPLKKYLAKLKSKQVKSDGNHLWALTYSLDYLLRLQDFPEISLLSQKNSKALIEKTIKLIERSRRADGAWTYAYSQGASFLTSPILLSLVNARERGYSVNSEMLDKAVNALEKSRLPHGGFPYVFAPNAEGHIQSSVQAGAGRRVACELALYQAGQGSVEKIKKSLEVFFEHWTHLDERRGKKPRRNTRDFHGGPYKIAPYYFMYSHYYVSQAIELMPDELKDIWRKELMSRLQKSYRPKVGWSDMPVENSPYATAVALLIFLAPLSL